MTRTTIDKARREARAVAARDGITHQQALDAVARARGHAHWAAFRADPVDHGAFDLDALMGRAWRRRSSALRFDIDDIASVATVTGRNRTGSYEAGDEVELERLRRAIAGRFGMDISGPEAERRVGMRVDGVRIEVAVNNCRVGDAHRLVIHMPDAVFGSATLADLGITDLGGWLDLVTRHDRGLVLVVGTTMSGRSTTIDRTVRIIADRGLPCRGFQEGAEREAAAWSHNGIALLEAHGRAIGDVAGNAWMVQELAGARILGGIEQRIDPDGDAGVLVSHVVEFEAGRRIPQGTAGLD